MTAHPGPFTVLEYGVLDTPTRSDMIIGMECYYKRTQASGVVRVYFRHLDHRDTFDVQPPGAALFKYGEIYDVDFSTDPIQITTRTHPPIAATSTAVAP